MWAGAALSEEWRKAEIFFYGGVESYSMVPYVLRDARWRARMMHKTMEDSI